MGREDRVPDTALVHVVDDDPAVRDSLQFLLETAGWQTRTYASATEFLAGADGLRGGCVLTDVRMPDIDGLALQRRLSELGLRLPVIVMTGHGDVPIAVEALKTGAADFLEKPFDDDRLLRVVRDAMAASAAEQERTLARQAILGRMASLTPREREVLSKLVEGLPNKTIAYDLGTSPRTVEVQRARVMEKMAARSLPDLVRMVLEAGPPTPA
jgi:two-component system response regulator FixJ